jgi:hypothetical protein
MDKAKIRLLLDTIREKINSLKEVEKDLLIELGEGPKGKGLKTESKRKPGRQASPEMERTRKEMLRILKEANKPLSPIQIIEISKKEGTNLEGNLVRKALTRGKGKLFTQVERGLWIFKEKE